jgi:hypothetical protein
MINKNQRFTMTHRKIFRNKVKIREEKRYTKTKRKKRRKTVLSKIKVLHYSGIYIEMLWLIELKATSKMVSQ